MPSSLNFDSGLPIAKVNGGDMAGKVLHLDTGDTKKVKHKKLMMPKHYKLPPRKEAEIMNFLNDNENFFANSKNKSPLEKSIINFFSLKFKLLSKYCKGFIRYPSL